MHARGPLAAFAVFVLGGCSAQNGPGAPLGNYSVVGHPQASTCGAMVDTPDPWAFHVALSRDGKTLYWSWFDERPRMTGPVDGTNATLASSLVDNVDPSHGHDGPCNMKRDDRLTLTLASGDRPATFEGTLTYGFAPAEGANCADQLKAAGGPFDALPCTITYAISAKRE